DERAGTGGPAAVSAVATCRRPDDRAVDVVVSRAERCAGSRTANLKAHGSKRWTTQALTATRSINRNAMRSIGNTSTAAFKATAAFGMPYTALLAWSWAIV